MNQKEREEYYARTVKRLIVSALCGAGVILGPFMFDLFLPHNNNIRGGACIGLALLIGGAICWVFRGVLND